MSTVPGSSATLIAVADKHAAADAAVRLIAASLPAGSATTASAALRGGVPPAGPPGTVDGVPGTAAAVGRADGHAATPVDARDAIALSGGRTPIEAFRRLGALPLAWDRIDVFLADERCVPYDHPDSNARAIDEALGKRGYTLHGLPSTGSPGDRARAYAHELGNRPLALVLLGLGEDGHTASLFPGHGGLDADGTTVAILDAPKPPPERVSLTLPRIAAAERIVLLVTGAGKSEALRRTLDRPSPDAPASLLPRDRLTVIADADALRAARDAGLVPGP